jgi:hypothetical protein
MQGFGNLFEEYIMNTPLSEQLSAFLDNEELENFIKTAYDFLRERDKNLTQILLTQKARLQEIEGEILTGQLQDDSLREALAHVRGTLSYILAQIRQL